MTHVNVDKIASNTLRVMRETFNAHDLFVSSRVVRYDYDVINDQHICDVALIMSRTFYYDQLQRVIDIMRETSHNDDICDKLKFVVDDVSFTIGDGDDSHATKILGNDLNIQMIVWARHLWGDE